MKKILLFISFSTIVHFHSFGQEQSTDLSLLPDNDEKPEHVTATFKSTRLMNGHSIEQVGHGVLDFRISHRFNSLKGGLKDFFGLDGAVTRLGLDYGINPWLMIGIGRSTFDKELDGLVKARILTQTKDNSMPISLAYMATMDAKTGKIPVVNNQTIDVANRIAYSHSFILARKFSDRFSLQVSPTYVHYNMVPQKSDPNDVIAVGVGGRMKLTKRMSLNAEYYYVLPNTKLNNTFNSLALGLDIETGGHVFQLHFTNSTGMTQRAFIGQTTDSWRNGDVRFGFNITRVFTIVTPKEFR